jgi:hypothetical protein
MPDAEHCPICGQQLPAGTPQGLCAACQLDQNRKRDSAEPLELADPSQDALTFDPIPAEPSSEVRWQDDGAPAEIALPPREEPPRPLTAETRRHRFTAAEFIVVLVLAAALIGWQVSRAIRAEQRAGAERNRALEAEQRADEMADRASEAEQALHSLQAAARDRGERGNAMTQVGLTIEATVYLKTRIAGQVVSTCTGFVVDVQADRTVVVTSRRAALAELFASPAPLSPSAGKPEIEATFWSGQGPFYEQTVVATTIVADSSDGPKALAFLVFHGVKRPPAPITLDAPSYVTEGTRYFATGFSWGAPPNTLEQSNGNPPAIVTRGLIAALYPDDHGQLEAIQMEGLLPQGMSGAPIIDERDGTLIGVGVSQGAHGTPAQFIIPADAIRPALAGRVGALELTLESLERGIAAIHVRAPIVDPKGALEDLRIHIAPVSAGMIVPSSDGSWPSLPGTGVVVLACDRDHPSAAGSLKLALDGQSRPARKMLIQTAYKTHGGQFVFSGPTSYVLPARPGPIHRSDAPLKVILQEHSRKGFDLLLAPADPDQDCRIVKDQKCCQIEIPGNKVHAFASDVVSLKNRREPPHPAPMTLSEVDGDFIATVQVTSEIAPGPNLSQELRGKDVPFIMQSAGLCLYQDKENFVRLERTAFVTTGTLEPSHTVVFQAVKNGKQIERRTFALRDRPVYLILMRHDGRVVDGGTDTEFGALHIDLAGPSKWRIGLSASNTSARPLIARFEDFALLDDVAIIDAKFPADVN